MRRINVARPLALIILVALVLPGAAAGCANDQKVMAVADTMHSGLRPAVMEDPQLQEYLQKIGDRIIATAAEMDKGVLHALTEVGLDENGALAVVQMVRAHRGPLVEGDYGREG